MARKILIVEDEAPLLIGYREALADTGLEVLTASTLLDALDVFDANPDVELIALDALFPRAEGESPIPEHGRVCSGEKFIANARYRGTIIACSSEPSLNRRLVAAGAKHSSGKGLELCALIRKLLGLPPAVT